MDLEYLLPLLVGRQVHEEYLVEAALPQKFRRELRYVVRGRDDEHRRSLLLKPGDERGEYPGSRARVAERGALRTGEAFLQLVYPQDRRRDRLGDRDRAPHVLLR